MRKAVMMAEHDTHNKKHVCVSEYQQINLREMLKKFGKDVGINIGTVRLYSRQLFVALRHLSDLRIVDADIKFDNILCSGDLKQVRVVCVCLCLLFAISPHSLIPSIAPPHLGRRPGGEAVRLCVGILGARHGQRAHALPRQSLLPRARDHPRTSL